MRILGAIRILATLPLVLAVPAQAQWMEADCNALLEEVGTQADSLFGFLVEDVGDVDDDGIRDFAASAPFYSGSSFGRVSVHSGADGSLIWSKLGNRQSEIHGFSLNVLDDITGDGVAEVIGSGGWNGGLPGGRVRIYDGTNGDILQTWSGPAEFDNYGHSVATGGDFNGDGVPDIAFGAPGVDDHGQNAGQVRVYSSDDFSLIVSFGPPAFSSHGRFGNGLSFLGDINGDGRDDLAIGARVGASWDPPGSLHVIGHDGVQLQRHYVISDVNHGGAFDGDLIESGADYDGDGIHDILFGQWSIDEASLYSGVDGSLIHTFTGDGSDQALGTGKMIPDVSGDGHPDLIISGWVNDVGADNGGRVYIYDGADFSLMRTMTPTSAGWKLGTGISCFGDYNGDGGLDFLIGAPGTSFEGTPLGRVLIMEGVPVDLFGDINGDGSVDFADLLLLLAAWGPCDACAEDVNSDGAVDFNDLLLLLASWS